MIKNLDKTDNKKFYTADDVAELLNISKSTAYREIRSLNNELKKRGYITLSGRIPRKFFDEKFYC